MITLIKKLVHALFFDDLAVLRWIRFAIVGGGLILSQYSNDIVSLFENSPESVKVVKLLGLLFAAGGVMINLGEKNPKSDTPTA